MASHVLQKVIPFDTNSSFISGISLMLPISMYGAHVCVFYAFSPLDECDRRLGGSMIGRKSRNVEATMIQCHCLNNKYMEDSTSQKHCICKWMFKLKSLHEHLEKFKISLTNGTWKGQRNQD
ncbi:uncharacterized protein LOC131235477 [Magnolia sinica]|uniref:uncharacterized protein LOC131235477 n=1 Tax=Magnolia sinica TaxID=86752 RepID=UPI002657C522|nr:uncharacterized protein LOC131235477 [Magnolia sinica]